MSASLGKLLAAVGRRGLASAALSASSPGRVAALAAAGAGGWAATSDGDAAHALRRVAVATRHLALVLAEWKAHEWRARSLEEPAALADASATHTRIAEHLRDMALAQGGIYVRIPADGPAGGGVPARRLGTLSSPRSPLTTARP